MTQQFPPLKNDLFLRALRGESTERPPVWMMRQAGRYLPQYMELRKKYSFFERVETPELACEITIQPIDALEPDAAIIFSDILTIPQALGIDVQLISGRGPVLEHPVGSEKEAFAIKAEGVAEKLHYVMEAISMTRRELNGRVPLIGFAGAPWTLFCYMVEGQGSRDFSRAKAFLYQYPEASRHLLRELTAATVEYLRAQVEAGAQAVQLFDSWAGILGPDGFREWSLPALSEICRSIEGVPVILFAKGAWFALDTLATETGADAIGLDWTVAPEHARAVCGGEVILQGNFDPSGLLAPVPKIRTDVQRMIDRFGPQRYVANLGHGILPNIPVEHARAFVESVKEYRGEDSR
ncbi:MAG: uroporphyrinogen decarboxylase [Balneolaceae bacterium]